MATTEHDGRAAEIAAPTVRVLTVRQPHAHLLIYGSPNAGLKDVENRSKPTSYRGTLLIQASAKVDQAAYADYPTQRRLSSFVQFPYVMGLDARTSLSSVRLSCR